MMVLSDDVAITQSANSITELIAVLFAVTDFNVRVLTIEAGQCLPFGPLTLVHHSLQSGARAWVHQQTGQPLGYMEQLYTFVDMQRARQNGCPVIYISYLGLVKEADETGLNMAARWQDYQQYFPWEDLRHERHGQIMQQLLPAFQNWIDAAPDLFMRTSRQQRLKLGWGLSNYPWRPENILLRYELLYEVGLIPESPYYHNQFPAEVVGLPMQCDHRRILATALSRLRAKLQYRPLIFDLMPAQFTLYQLQCSIEALSGMDLHKQNFRRLLHHQQLVLPTGEVAVAERGRPAQLFRYNQNVLHESVLADSRLPLCHDHEVRGFDISL